MVVGMVAKWKPEKPQPVHQIVLVPSTINNNTLWVVCNIVMAILFFFKVLLFNFGIQAYGSSGGDPSEASGAMTALQARFLPRSDIDSNLKKE